MNKLIKKSVKLSLIAVVVALNLNVLVNSNGKGKDIDLFSLSKFAFATDEWEAYRYLWYNHGDPCTCPDGSSGTITACSRQKSYITADDCNPSSYPYVLCIHNGRQCN